MAKKETKTAMNARLSSILKAYKAGTRLNLQDSTYVLAHCKHTSKWAKKAGRSDTEVWVRMVAIARGRRPIKMLCLEGISHSTGKHARIPISKGKLVEAIHPKKTRQKKGGTSASSDKVEKVRSAMRLAIQDQITEYRSMIDYPTTCSETNQTIRKGMRTHVDHAGKPFVQLADEWLASVHLYYSDIELCGPPTAKRFKDEELARSWWDFHYRNAKLALCLASANISKGAGHNWNGSERMVRPDDATKAQSISLNF